ncbi:uncharacterized protein LOC141928095 [Strix aluco]|uniref:uncharacterized protein LOC141928091 n=2 Tax=Strix aluco TaxID=111821 RepID=UPI003DA6C1B5
MARKEFVESCRVPAKSSPGPSAALTASTFVCPPRDPLKVDGFPTSSTLPVPEPESSPTARLYLSSLLFGSDLKAQTRKDKKSRLRCGRGENGFPSPEHHRFFPSLGCADGLHPQCTSGFCDICTGAVLYPGAAVVEEKRAHRGRLRTVARNRRPPLAPATAGPAALVPLSWDQHPMQMPGSPARPPSPLSPLHPQPVPGCHDTAQPTQHPTVPAIPVPRPPFPSCCDTAHLFWRLGILIKVVFTPEGTEPSHKCRGGTNGKPPEAPAPAELQARAQPWMPTVSVRGVTRQEPGMGLAEHSPYSPQSSKNVT